MSAESPMGASPGIGRALPIDHLRATLILLVIAHHAVLAYVSYAPAPGAAWDAPPMMWRAFPIVDAARAPALDLLVAFNDAVLMSLLFFLAGLFTWRSLRSKGALGFLSGRARRLGLPFVVGTAALAPLAYYPAYLQHGGESGLGPYARAWLSLEVWPSGPMWFLWVLLAFSGLAALGYRLAPGWGEALAARLGPIGERPWAFFGLWVAASALVYLPMAQVFNPMTWFELGPLTVQTSRVLHYALYFVFGIGIGAHGTGAGLLSPGGRLARQLSLFVRFGHWTSSLWRSLDRNAYGVYLVHYVFVNWLLLAVLGIDAPAVAKAAIVFTGAAALSWTTSILLRRIPGVARVI